MPAQTLVGLRAFECDHKDRALSCMDHTEINQTRTSLASRLGLFATTFVVVEHFLFTFAV